MIWQIIFIQQLQQRINRFLSIKKLQCSNSFLLTLDREIILRMLLQGYTLLQLLQMFLSECKMQPLLFNLYRKKIKCKIEKKKKERIFVQKNNGKEDEPGKVVTVKVYDGDTVLIISG